ncbi:KIR protein [Plasmodium coatneyi]|uniref:KIR protein n=1 Tax=Plasmodium coatneyi TaxID=208452 RepID=A0A1B1E3A3_9APIC|nr:KIR protein [Plasmodium coatneyi]ANQ09478.1 KIR protein [Plasmodium coatneyi]
MTLGDDDAMEELPSQKRYKEADKKTCSQVVSRGDGGAMPCNQELWTTVKGALEVIHAYNEELSNKIVQNCSYACAGGSGSGDPSYYDRCKFLYYWLGTKIKETGKVKTDTTFQTVMSAIYKHQRSTHFWNSCKNHCTLVYPHITDDLFQNSKILHDYEYDYNKLKDDKEGKGECHKYCNNNQCEVPSEAAKSAYAKVKGICQSLSGDAYCDEFDKQYKKEGTKYEEELPQLTCPTEPSEDEEEDEDYIGLGSCSGEEDGDEGDISSCATIKTKSPKKVPAKKLTKQNLEVLTSRVKYYDNFKGGGNYCYYCPFPRKEIREAIKEYFTDDKYATVIANALCYVSTKEKEERETEELKKLRKAEEEEEEAEDGTDEPDNGKRCKFFNFWLGYLLHKKLREPATTSFSTVIEAINDILNGIKEGHKCTLLGTDPTLNKDDLSEDDFMTFNHRRIVFEYSIDHKRIEQDLGLSAPGPKLPKPPKSTTPSCSKKYNEHLQNIKTGCRAMNTSCNTSTPNADDYCSEFKKNYESFCKEEKISLLECPEVADVGGKEEVEGGGEEDLLLPSSSSLSKVNELPPDDPTGSCTEQLSGGTTTTNTTPTTTVVSSILAAVGLPAISALLYKYTSVPSLLRTQFEGGGGRNHNSSVRNIRKRTTTTSVERDFDDDTSIIGGSTTEYDSTIGDSSTVYSIPYNR